MSYGVLNVFKARNWGGQMKGIEVDKDGKVVFEEDKEIDKDTELQFDEDGELIVKGIGGWLLLLGFGLGVAPLAFLFRSIDSSIRIFCKTSLVEIYSSNRILAVAIIFGLAMQLCLFVFSSYNLYLFVKKKKKFPEFMILFFICNLCFLIIDSVFMLLLGQEGKLGSRVINPMIVWTIWSLYLLKSKRVKNTFIN
jgi:hypothetical protein